MECIVGALEDLVCDIFKEMKSEPGSSAEKISIIDDILSSQNTGNFIHFLQILSDPILSALTERTKVFPSNQYEEFLSKLNHLLNQSSYVEDLKFKLVMLLSKEVSDDAPVLGMLLFRLCHRLSEEIQILLLNEMSQKKRSEQVEVPLHVPSSEEEKLFYDKMCNVIRINFTKASSLNTEVWRARCECIRHRFIDIVDEPFCASDIINKSLWLDSTINLSDDIVSFCVGAVRVIDLKVKEFKTSVSSDELVKLLLDSGNCDVVNKWHSLTSGYLGEVDSIVFMRDLISILVKLSVRHEEAKLKGEEEERRRLQKFSVRDDLKRN